MVGRTDCKNYFWKIRKGSVGIANQTSKAHTKSFFSCQLDFHNSKNTEELGDLLEEFKKNFNTENNVFGKEQKLDRLIVINDVSGLADKSNAFASFSTVSRKFKYNCVYIFHIIYPEK